MASIANKLPPLCLFLWLVFAGVDAVAAGPDQRRVDIYLFSAEGCPHCARASAFFRQWAAEEPRIRVHPLEITREPANRELFAALIRHFGIERPAVPLTVIGERFLVGYDNDATTGAVLKNIALDCLQTSCADLTKSLIKGAKQPVLKPSPIRARGLPEVLHLPVLGEIEIAHVSLPLLTILLAAVDGFNPCAMWTLVFLIGLLIGLQDRFRMWVLGGAFISASAAVYYLFMAAWLNLLLFLGMLLWLRIVIIGIIALAGGGYYLHQYLFNTEAVCKVTAPEARKRVFERLRALAAERSFVLALGGIVLLAFAVNLVELICSAGIPAVYTQVLALSRLAPWQYHAYIGLYILVFMLDDLIVFVVAMKTLQLAGLTGSYLRYGQAIGGGVLIALGLMLLFKPEWLVFTVY